MEFLYNGITSSKNKNLKMLKKIIEKGHDLFIIIPLNTVPRKY